MKPWLEMIDIGTTAHTLRRLQGAFDVALADARARLRLAGSLRERVDLLAEAQLCEEGIARCRAVRAAQSRRRGWGHLAPRQPARPAHAATYRRDAATRAPTLAAAVSQPPPAARVGAGRGVAGATPPPGMGHGWPAFAGAGSAPAPSPDAGKRPAVSVKSAPHPANPSFCDENEGISTNVGQVEDIHYAQ